MSPPPRPQLFPPGGAEWEIVLLTFSALLPHCSFFFLLYRKFVFPKLPTFLSLLRGLLAPTPSAPSQPGVNICGAVFAFLYFSAYVFPTFCVLLKSLSHSVSLRRPFYHRGNLQGGCNRAAQQSEENCQAVHSGQSQCVWV